MQGKVKSTVMEVDERVHTLTESFEPFAPEARPGDRLLDCYADHLHFDEHDPAQDRRPYLDELIVKARADPSTVLAATDGSVPQSNQYQVTSAAIIYKGHHELERTRYVSGRITAPDAELNAISCAVRLAVKQVNCQHIMAFTDSMGSAHRAVDPGMHSGQAFSLSICHVLQEWFQADDLRHITFVYVPSAMWWDIHGEAHKYITELKVRVGRHKTDNSIDALHSRAAHSVLDSWNSTFQDPTYRGSEFLELQQPDGWLLQPLYLNGGPWLSTFGHSITEFARVCQCITGHAPIGAYYHRFKIKKPHGCTCGAALQSLLAATDGSVPQSNQYQVALAAIIYKGHRELERTRYVSGRVTAPEAELNAISCAVRLAVKQANCQHIMVFTDSMSSAHRAVDPGVHSGQAFSLSVCRALQEWFEADDLCHITFVYVPSALRWDIHGEAHKHATLSSGALSPGFVEQDPTYRGSEFLELQQPDGRPLQPSYLNGGPWLSTFGHSITEFARVCRCITGHAPIGAYYRRFKINEPHGCTCGAALQSRQHILFRCHDRYSVHYPRFLGDIASFMKYNPMAFGFNRDPSGVG
ncbi:unnamed protein product [Cyclocybe aegerita]|uniref:RNase H type-1 domain-containing protein n=1 Tax=Cyclocybe aegerita TaxID=1973307 RepID=A0A8S0X8T4_CYCAE|nr:unnamed protein product [Cyclocybe aegerita]